MKYIITIFVLLSYFFPTSPSSVPFSNYEASKKRVHDDLTIPVYSKACVSEDVTCRLGSHKFGLDWDKCEANYVDKRESRLETGKVVFSPTNNDLFCCFRKVCSEYVPGETHEAVLKIMNDEIISTKFTSDDFRSTILHKSLNDAVTCYERLKDTSTGGDRRIKYTWIALSGLFDNSAVPSEEFKTSVCKIFMTIIELSYGFVKSGDPCVLLLSRDGGLTLRDRIIIPDGKLARFLLTSMDSRRLKDAAVRRQIGEIRSLFLTKVMPSLNVGLITSLSSLLETALGNKEDSKHPKEFILTILRNLIYTSLSDDYNLDVTWMADWMKAFLRLSKSDVDFWSPCVAKTGWYVRDGPYLYKGMIKLQSQFYPQLEELLPKMEAAEIAHSVSKLSR
jgi:hypothetical protein